jgi:uncharacterized protein (TIGR02391 family)
MPVEDLANRTGNIVPWVQAWDAEEGRAARSQAETAQAHPKLVRVLAEAWDWLQAEGFIAHAVLVNQTSDAVFVTRRGRAMLEEDDPLGVIRAQRRLGLELHAALRSRLRPLVRAGAFEQAAFDALREVEVRVRELAGDPRDKNGQPYRAVALMNHVFGGEGVLTDPGADAGEQQGIRSLFAGAFGAVRNPLGHQNVEWEDPTEAAEMVLLADLLMRQLDRVARRTAAPAESTT